MECVNLTINDDDNFEQAETLTMQLTNAQSGLVIDTARTMARITILDLDGELKLAL